MEVMSRIIADGRFTQVQKWLSSADIRIRKQLLLLCRYMGTDTHGNLISLTYDAMCSWTDYLYPNANNPFLPGEHNYDSASAALHEVVSDPFLCGAVIMSILIADLPDAVVQEQKLESYLKEIRVMDSTPYLPHVDWSVFFGNYGAPFHPLMKPNPPNASIVHQAIDSWRKTVAAPDKLYFPRISSKLLPSFTRREMSKYVDLLIQPPELSTQGSLEWLYAKHGVEFIDGGCELKQRWYTNGLTPRSYFVCGAEGYDRSKYVHKLFNDLNQSLITVSRFNRVNPQRIHIRHAKTAVFYDLTSFTSNCGLQKPFIDALATYCSGTNISIMDTRLGPIEIDLGDLLREYNEMNHLPEYDCPALFESLVNSRHGVAGFLGVNGNIMSCTFLHGAFLLQLCDYEDECGCAGDDAVVICEDEQYVFGCISLIGILAVEKTFVLYEGTPAVVYLKRRTFMDPVSRNLRQHSYFQFPSFLPFMRGDHALKRFREAIMTRTELHNLAVSSISSSFRSAARFRSHPCFDRIVGFLYEYYAALDLPIEGHVPQFSKIQQKRYGFLPGLDSLGNRDFVEITLQSLYPGFAFLPIRTDMFTYRVPVRKGIFFQSSGDPHVSLLQKLGVVEPVKKLKQMVTGVDGLTRVIQEFVNPYRDPARVLYEVKVDFEEAFGSGTIPGAIDLAGHLMVDPEPDVADLFDVEASVRVDSSPSAYTVRPHHLNRMGTSAKKKIQQILTTH